MKMKKFYVYITFTHMGFNYEHLKHAVMHN